ncbi:hypothetical protein EMIT0373P_30159 [Pseudomonas chlororaphis]
MKPNRFKRGIFRQQHPSPCQVGYQDLVILRLKALGQI